MTLVTTPTKRKYPSAPQTLPSPEAANPAPETAVSPAGGPGGNGAAGGGLIAALMDAATKRGHTLANLATALGVTYGYLVQLRAGNRSCARISDDFASRCAKYLGLPRLSVLLLAGRITQDDFFEASAVSPRSLAMAYDYIRRDPRWGARVPALSAEAIQESRHLVLVIVWFYQEMRGVDLLFGVDDTTFWPAVDGPSSAEDMMDGW